MAITKTKLVIEVNEPIHMQATAVQMDGNSRYLDVCLYDKGVPIDLTGHVVRINVKRKDSTVAGEFNQGEITDATAGRCQFLLSASMLEEVGTLEAQISIWNSDTEILSTKIFEVLVTRSLRNDEEVEATNEFGVLVVLFTEIQSALELMQEMTDTFGLPGEMAEAYGVDTFWGMMEHLAKGADVEHALKTHVNSTIGTEDETPLNVLLTAGQDAIKAVVDAIKTSLTTGGVPIVRHIQRGTGYVAYDADTATVTLSGFTNLDKMSVRVYGGRTVTTGEGEKTDTAYYPVYFGDVSATSLTVKCDGDDSISSRSNRAYFSYEVIEFW